MVKEVTIPSRVIKGFKVRTLSPAEYQKVAEGTAEQFGEDSRAYKTIMNGIDAENGTGSQFLFNTQAGLYLPGTQRIATYDDLGTIQDGAPQFFDGSFYTDTRSLVLRSTIPSWDKNNKILENLVSQVQEMGLEFSPENPLLLTGLELQEDSNSDNFYGLTLGITNKTTRKNDPRFAHGNRSIPFGNSSKHLWTKQNGLSRVYFYWDGSIGSGDGGLSNSNSDGRVVSFDAEGVANE